MKILSRKGQALLIVIVAMVVALALGVNVSMRTLSTVSRTTRTDTSERVRMAAEGGAERVLGLPITDLKDGLSSDECSGVGGSIQVDGKCMFTFNNPADPIQEKAYVDVTDYVIDTNYEFKLEQNSVTEVVLNNTVSSVDICWTFIDPTKPVDLYYVAYSNSTNPPALLNKGAFSISPSGIPSPYSAHNFTTVSKSGSKACYTNLSVSGATGLRLKAIGGDTKVAVSANKSDEQLPNQGYKIDSTGQLVEDGAVKVTKEVLVYKSYPFLPGIFDYAILSNSGALNY